MKIKITSECCNEIAALLLRYKFMTNSKDMLNARSSVEGVHACTITDDTHTSEQEKDSLKEHFVCAVQRHTGIDKPLLEVTWDRDRTTLTVTELAQ